MKFQVYIFLKTSFESLTPNIKNFNKKQSLFEITKEKLKELVDKTDYKS